MTKMAFMMAYMMANWSKNCYMMAQKYDQNIPFYDAGNYDDQNGLL